MLTELKSGEITELIFVTLALGSNFAIDDITASSISNSSNSVSSEKEKTI